MIKLKTLLIEVMEEIPDKSFLRKDDLVRLFPSVNSWLFDGVTVYISRRYGGAIDFIGGEIKIVAPNNYVLLHEIGHIWWNWISSDETLKQKLVQLLTKDLPHGISNKPSPRPGTEYYWVVEDAVNCFAVYHAQKNDVKMPGHYTLPDSIKQFIQHNQ